MIFFKNTSFPDSKSYSIDRKHISDTPRHSIHVQKTILKPKMYFGDEKYDFFLLKLQRKITNFFQSFYIGFPAFYTGSYTKRSKKFFFQNTSFPYFKSYSDVRKHISDTSRHSRRVQNTILIYKMYF